MGDTPVATFPAHFGFQFTNKIHSKAEGATDPKNNKPHNNFVVVVAGASRGIGYSIALSYAQAGAKGIVISSRTQADLDNLAAEIKQINPSVEVLVQKCDVLQQKDVEKLALATQDRFGRVDTVVANAGIISNYIIKPDGKKYIANGVVEDDDFKKVLDTNVIGSWNVAREFVPLLQATPDGPQAFILLSSVVAHGAFSTYTPLSYAISKLAIARLAEGIKNDHGEDGKGVVAYAVHPGSVITTQTEKHHETQLGSAWNDLLGDDVALCGGFLTWLTREKRTWLSGRYVAVTWDVEQLEQKKDEIVEKDLLTFRMTV